MPVYPGDPTARIVQNNHVTKDGFTSHTITIGTHIGTHIDAPAHMIANGKNIFDYPVEHFIGNGVLIDARNKKKIDLELLDQVPLQENDIVLLYTQRDTMFNTTEYFTDYPEITTNFAQKLVDAKVKIVGMDQASPDYKPFATHKLLLKNNILIIENLTNLNKLIGKQFTILALPLNIKAEAGPVRVVAQVN